MNTHRIGIIGFGEVGKIFAKGLHGKPGVASVTAWDIRWQTRSPTPDDLAAIGESRAQATASMRALCEASDFIISAVTAANALAAVTEAAQFIQSGSVLLDLNSASPGTKQKAAQLIEARGGRYLEAGVMTSVPPYGIKVPLLIGGAHAAALAPLLTNWGMDARVVSDSVGTASAIKMCRSVMIKGLEALVIESFTTARAYGVEDHVIPTLVETFPQIDWERQGDYFFSRVIAHGVRRAEEMVEAARTVDEAVLEPIMTRPIAARQAWVAAQVTSGVLSKGPVRPWREHADKLIADARRERQ